MIETRLFLLFLLLGFAFTDFIDVTSSAGLTYQQQPLPLSNCLFESCMPAAMTGGAAVGDFNNDNLPDIYATRLFDRDLLFRNNGDGTFEDVAFVAGLDLTSTHRSSGVLWCDIDNDNDLDIYVTTIGNPEVTTIGNRYFLYVNNGDGTFTEDAITRGLAVDDGVARIGTSATCGDFNNDGLLDIFVGQWNGMNIGVPAVHSKLFKNTGNGFFEDVTNHHDFVDHSHPDFEEVNFTPVFVDMDKDGDQDLIIAADFGQSQYYENENGVFRHVVDSGCCGEQFGMGTTVGDVDKNGFLDWYITSIGNPDVSGITGNRMYLNDGDSLTDATDETDTRYSGWGWGTTFIDFDNDSDLDLIATNGWPFNEAYTNDITRAWENVNGDGEEMMESQLSLGITDTGLGRSVVTLDYDSDGDVDVLISQVGPGAILYENQAIGNNANGYLRVKTPGTSSNSKGIGAQITVIINDGDAPLYQQMGANSHFLGHSESDVAHFGLGPGSDTVFSVSVFWPATGLTALRTSVPRNSILVIPEPAGPTNPFPETVPCNPRCDLEEACVNGECICEISKECNGKTCGTGCNGASCGLCEPNHMCVDGACQCNVEDECNGVFCGIGCAGGICGECSNTVGTQVLYIDLSDSFSDQFQEAALIPITVSYVNGRTNRDILLQPFDGKYLMVIVVDYSSESFNSRYSASEQATIQANIEDFTNQGRVFLLTGRNPIAGPDDSFWVSVLGGTKSYDCEYAMVYIDYLWGDYAQDLFWGTDPACDIMLKGYQDISGIDPNDLISKKKLRQYLNVDCLVGGEAISCLNSDYFYPTYSTAEGIFTVRPMANDGAITFMPYGTTANDMFETRFYKLIYNNLLSICNENVECLGISCGEGCFGGNCGECSTGETCYGGSCCDLITECDGISCGFGPCGNLCGDYCFEVLVVNYGKFVPEQFLNAALINDVTTVIVDGNTDVLLNEIVGYRGLIIQDAISTQFSSLYTSEELSTIRQNIENFVNQGNFFLLTGEDSIAFPVDTFWIPLLGGTTALNCVDAAYSTRTETDYDLSWGTDPVCDVLLTGYQDITNLDPDSFAQSYDGDMIDLDCLIGGEAVSCLNSNYYFSSSYPTSSGIFTVRPMMNEGSIVFMSSGINGRDAFESGFYQLVYNNLLQNTKDRVCECGDCGISCNGTPCGTCDSDEICSGSRCTSLNRKCDSAVRLRNGIPHTGRTNSVSSIRSIYPPCFSTPNDSPVAFFSYTTEFYYSEISIDTCDSFFPATISVFTGTCEDLDCYGTSATACGSSGRIFESGESYASRFPLGTDLIFIISGVASEDSGSFTVTLTETGDPVPFNSVCESRIPLNLGGVQSGTTLGSGTLSSSLPDCGGSADNPSPVVFYSYVIPEDGGDIISTNLISTCAGGNFDTKIQVYTGDCNNLVCIGANDNSCGTLSSLSVDDQPPGTELIIAVTSNNNQAGNFQISDQGESCFASGPEYQCATSFTIYTDRVCDEGQCGRIPSHDLGFCYDFTTCGCTISKVSGVNEGDIVPSGMYEVHSIATNSIGISSDVCSFRINVAESCDSKGPKMICPKESVTLNTRSSCSLDGEPCAVLPPIFLGTCEDLPTCQCSVTQIAGESSGAFLTEGTYTLESQGVNEFGFTSEETCTVVVNVI